MKKINFISNQDLNVTSGGWSGINFNIHRELEKHLKVNYVGPINPPVNLLEKSHSKLYRTLGLRGNFNFFSESRLQKIDSEVKNKLEKADYNLFFGQTPWLKCNYNTAYGVYLDADFITYLKIFSKIETFSKKDVDRIAKQEKKWLQNATHIFVGSQWAWDEMVKVYGLNELQKHLVYTGGNVEMPDKDKYDGGYNFVFISLNFEKKGGHICVGAFKKIRKRYPSATLTIMGEKPPTEVLEEPGIEYVGMLKKTDAEDLKKFKDILSKAFLLVHPTKMDTMGAVLIEAGYFGCPSIAPRSFGIPELVKHDETGIIIENPFTAEDFATEIEKLLKDEKKYLQMRANAWGYTRNEMTWEAIGHKINKQIMG